MFSVDDMIGIDPLQHQVSFYLFMLKCLRQLRGAAITGATGVGKTETVKGLAYTLGRYLALFGCSPNSDPLAMGKMVQGLAMVITFYPLLQLNAT